MQLWREDLKRAAKGQTVQARTSKVICFAGRDIMIIGLSSVYVPTDSNEETRI